jgi:RNA polymerase sigma factor (sigma-70 family)
VGIVRAKFLRDPLFYLGLELLEKQCCLKEPSPQCNANLALAANHAVKKLKTKNIFIPGLRERVQNQDQWSDETALAYEVVYREMFHRMRQDPLKVIFYQYRGSLSRTIFIVLYHRVIDLIRALTADKCDFRKTVSLEQQIPNRFDEEETLTLEDTIAYPESSLDDAVEAEDAYERLTACLTPEEKLVVNLKIKDCLHQDIIASRLGYHPSKVSRILNRAYQKIRSKAS